MNQGKLFEQDIKKSVPPNVYYYRLQDSASGWSSSDSDNVRFTPKNKFDCLLFTRGVLILLELKSTQGTSIPYSMIKDHQIEELNKASVYDGIKAGFLFNFRKSTRTYFMDIKDFIGYKDATDKKSINERDIEAHNGILIDQTLMRTRYKYYLEGLINSFKPMFIDYL